MQVGDILRKKTARVATVRMNETVAIAAQLMRASNISALVVKDVVRTEGNTAVGMFTERDVVRQLAEHGLEMLDGSVGAVMTAPAITVELGTEVMNALGLMTRRRFRHLPVVQGGRMVGFVSIGDLVKYRIERIEAEAEAMRSYIQSA